MKNFTKQDWSFLKGFEVRVKTTHGKHPNQQYPVFTGRICGVYPHLIRIETSAGLIILRIRKDAIIGLCPVKPVAIMILQPLMRGDQFDLNL